MDKRELRKAVRDRNGIPDPGDGLAGHTDIDDAIRSALADVSAENRWPWLLTSASVTFGTDGLPTTALPDHSEIKRLIVDGATAEHVGEDDFATSNGRRCVWTNYANTIQLAPSPTANLTATLWYYRAEPELDTDVATPLLPATFHQTLVARASYHLNSRRGRSTEVARDLVEWQSGLANIMQAKIRTAGPRTVRSAFGEQRPRARWR